MKIQKCMFAPLFMLASILLFYVYIFTPSRGGCDVSVLSRMPSPDGKWEAIVNRKTCSDGAFTTSSTKNVELVLLAEDNNHHAVFSMEDDGHDDNEPLVSWDGKKNLSIAVRAADVVNATSQVNDVNITVRSLP